MPCALFSSSVPLRPFSLARGAPEALRRLHPPTLKSPFPSTPASGSTARPPRSEEPNDTSSRPPSRSGRTTSTRSASSGRRGAKPWSGPARPVRVWGPDPDQPARGDEPTLDVTVARAVPTPDAREPGGFSARDGPADLSVQFASIDHSGPQFGQPQRTAASRIRSQPAGNGGDLSKNS